MEVAAEVATGDKRPIQFSVDHETLSRPRNLMMKLRPDHGKGCRHIALTFREMWDTAALNLPFLNPTGKRETWHPRFAECDKAFR